MGPTVEISVRIIRFILVCGFVCNESCNEINVFFYFIAAFILLQLWFHVKIKYMLKQTCKLL